MEQKKFLDLDGLKRYDGKIKELYKVKNVDTKAGTVALTLDEETGKVGVTFDANIVTDANYETVSTKATNSAAAWDKFLEGTTNLYPNNVTPGLKDLATKTEAQGYANTAKSDVIGTANDASTDDTIKGAKKYAKEQADAALEAAGTAQSTANDAKIAAANAQDTADDAVALIGTTKTDLLGNADTDSKDSATIAGAKKYADSLASGLSSRIDSLEAGGIEFKGVVNAIPAEAKDGDLIIMGADVTVGDVTYKKDYEYIYSDDVWYELGDSDKNAKAIADVDKAAVKSVVGGNSTYVTVTASEKDAAGQVTLTVSDTIVDTFDTIESVNSKIVTAISDLIGTDSDATTADTIKGAKKYADNLVATSFAAISDDDIDALFA